MNVLITGTRSGLGYALASFYIERGDRVYGLSRRTPDNADRYSFHVADLADPGATVHALCAICPGKLDLVLLNAGTLGSVGAVSKTSMQEMKRQMDVNVWGNKSVLDYLIQHKVRVEQVIAISSGASISGNLGWNGYSLSKAALNMLIKLYASEMTDTHLCALAPGLVGTPMLESIVNGSHDTTRYATVQTIRESQEKGLVQSPASTAERIDSVRTTLRSYPSGEYLDIRNITP